MGRYGNFYVRVLKNGRAGVGVGFYPRFSHIHPSAKRVYYNVHTCYGVQPVLTTILLVISEQEHVFCP